MVKKIKKGEKKEGPVLGAPRGKAEEERAQVCVCMCACVIFLDHLNRRRKSGGVKNGRRETQKVGCGGCAQAKAVAGAKQKRTRPRETTTREQGRARRRENRMMYEAYGRTHKGGGGRTQSIHTILLTLNKLSATNKNKSGQRAVASGMQPQNRRKKNQPPNQKTLSLFPFVLPFLFVGTSQEPFGMFVLLRFSLLFMSFPPLPLRISLFGFSFFLGRGTHCVLVHVCLVCCLLFLAAAMLV